MCRRKRQVMLGQRRRAASTLLALLNFLRALGPWSIEAAR